MKPKSLLNIVPAGATKHVITGETWLALRHPIVYGWRRGKKYLYIGCSMHGVGRIFARKDTLAQEIKSTDRIDVWVFADVSIVRLLEIEKGLIRLHRPLHNVTHLYKRYKQPLHRA